MDSLVAADTAAVNLAECFADLVAVEDRPVVQSDSVREHFRVVRDLLAVVTHLPAAARS